MKKLISFTLLVLLASCSQPVKESTEIKLETYQDSMSYGIGMDIGTNFNSTGIEINPDILGKGFKDAYSGGEKLISDEDMRSIVIKAQAEFREKSQEKARLKSIGDKEEGEKFLQGNSTKPGIITLKSGLQYKVINSGDGESPLATSQVEVHYTGKLLDGTVFDSSVQRGTPAKFAVNQVIKGWTEALQLMKVGDKWELYIPSDLAYGPRGSQGAIPPNNALIFEIELLGIQ